MTPKLSRMDGYIRVSKVGGRAGDSFISPAVQRDQIEGWAKLRGVEVAAWHEDLDQSGGKLDRPGLAAMLERIEAGETEGVIVAKLDRLSRLGVAEALKLVEQITEAGGSIAAIDLGVDPTTPTGELMMMLMLGMAHMERRRLGDAWDEAKARAMARGAKIGPAPYGYQRAEDGTIEPQPDEAPIIAEAYRLAAQEGIEAARAHMLRAAPERTSNNYTTRRLLANRAYLGESHYGKRVVKGAHPAIVDRATWEAAQREPTVRHRAKGTFPLSGIAVCGTCGAHMIGHRSHDRNSEQGPRAYRCSARASCPAPASTRADKLESLVREALRDDWSEGYNVGGGDEDMSAVETALLEAEAELEAFAGDLTARRALGARYHDHLEARVAAVNEAQATYRVEASKQARQTRVLPVELLDTEDPAELCELFAAGLAAVIVAKGRGPIEGRLRLVPHGHDELPGVPAPKDSARGSVKSV